MDFDLARPFLPLHIGVFPEIHYLIVGVLYILYLDLPLLPRLIITIFFIIDAWFDVDEFE